MSDAKENGSKPTRKASSLIQPRPRAGPLVGTLLALVFAGFAAVIVQADVLFTDTVDIEEGVPAPVTVRLAPFSGSDGDRVGRGTIVVARDQVPDHAAASMARRVTDNQLEGGWAILAFFLAFFLLSILLVGHMRRSHDGRLLRTQAVTLLLLLGAALIMKLLLMLTTVSSMVAPVAGFAIVAALTVDLSVGIGVGLAGAVLMACLVPFDAGVVSVLGVQSVVAVLFLGERRRGKFEIVLAGCFGGFAAAVVYGVFYFLAWHEVPIEELSKPLHSAWLAAGIAGPVSAMLAFVALPAVQLLLGNITLSRLVELEDLSNPLLKQIAERSPGTWQHSLAMANMAEIAANAIGASGRLIRVGAYYHDLGKSLQPKYFIENLRSGEASPHDSLEPEVSCDAIFAHVTEGVRVGRKHGLPERIIDFMHMHHGDGLLEYFWTKCREAGNPKGLTEEDFRYPGVKPHSKETAILAIVDAVEAASRTLRSPDEQSVRNLVQRIVYGKLHLGQLDESGLTVADLRRISDSLIDTIQHANHGRIEYPWQKEQRAAEAREGAAATSQRVPTSRMVQDVRLDSLDVPRPYWRDQREPRASDPPPVDPHSATIPLSSPHQLLADGELEQSVPDSIDDQVTSPTRQSSAEGRRAADTIPVEGGRTLRPQKETISLMDSHARSAQVVTDEPSGPVVVGRAMSENEELSAGVVVVGPPPATHPELAESKRASDE